MSGGSADGGTVFVPVAEVVKAVGLGGEIKLYPLLDWHAPLLASRFLRWEDGTPAALRAIRAARGGEVAAVEGCRGRDAAEALVGRRLGFRRVDYLEADFPRPPGGLPFRYLGRTVKTVAGAVVGTVDEVRRYAAQVTLVILRGGREILIPAVAPILAADEALEGPLVVDPPEGLLDDAGD